MHQDGARVASEDRGMRANGGPRRLLGSPAGHGCFLSLLPTCLPGGLGLDTNPLHLLPWGGAGAASLGGGEGAEGGLRHFPTLKCSGTSVGPTWTGESGGQAERYALDVGTTMPHLPHQFDRVPFGLFGAHTSFPFSPLRAGSNVAPCQGPWNPGCQHVFQSLPPT